MIKAVVFDLDDTLYDEFEYVSQAIQKVAVFLADRLPEQGQSERLHSRMLELLEKNGRGRIFDDICKEIGVETKIEELVEIYRGTKPVLRLYQDAELLLESLESRNIKTGLITDGCSQVQHEKIRALGLDERLDCVIATDDFGMSKPQTEPYEKCLAELGCRPQEAVYVGDNPCKDFIGAKKLGMKTFRILRARGMHMKDAVPPEWDAEDRIFSLTEIEKRVE